MKPILSIIMFLFLVSCNQESSHNPAPQPPVLADLNLGGLKTLVPLDVIKSKNYAVFVNENGEEKYLKIIVEEGYKDLIFESIHYKSEFFEYSLSDTLNTSYGISTKLRNQYTSLTRSDGVCTSALLSGYNNGYFPSITLSSDGDFIFGKSIESVVINNKTFLNVVTQFPIPNDYNSYSELYYSTELGVVGFEGDNNEMWALDRYE